MRTEAVDRAKLVFTLFDANGDGALEAEDFELMSGRVLEAARDSDEAAKQAISASFQHWWTTLSTELDANHDGRISPDEFHAVVLSPERFDDTINEFAVALSTLGAPAGDGLVSRPVFVALMTAIGFDLANINTLFDAFGPSADDKIEANVWLEAIKDYYHPDKAGIAGDLLVGS
jgi:Ca2+-binding EF-hand superfamily protein